MPSTAVTSIERFHIKHVALATRALLCYVILTFDLLTLKLVSIVAFGVGNQLEPDIYSACRADSISSRVKMSSLNVVLLDPRP